MREDMNYQQKQLEAIQAFYYELKQKTAEDVSLNDVVVSWFTDGYAEKFRMQYLQDCLLVS